MPILLLRLFVALKRGFDPSLEVSQLPGDTRETRCFETCSRTGSIEHVNGGRAMEKTTTMATLKLMILQMVSVATVPMLQ